MRPLHRNVVNVLSATVKKNWRAAWIDVIENKKAAQEVTFLSVANLAEELFKTRLPEIDPAYGISILRRQIQGYGTKEPITPS